MISRRLFVQIIAAASTAPAIGAAAAPAAGRFGPLLPDPNEVLDLPAGFRYRIISRHGDEMDDGLLVPARADGMAAFPGSNGTVTLVCNHENHPSGGGPFGEQNERLERIDASRVYDRGDGITPGTGGTTTIVYDPVSGKTLRRHLSLAGTEVNCAGGSTPWGSWLSCEECVEVPGISSERRRTVHREKRHGYIFEVPADARGAVVPEPLLAMGRFEHEAAAVDPRSGLIYLSEDQHESLLYRFTPAVPGELREGGRLQALAVDGRPSFDTRNWETGTAMAAGDWHTVHWQDLLDVDAEEDDLRLRGFASGAACFARGEGLCFADGSLFLAATIGGPERLGQIFEYQPAKRRLRLLSQATAGGILYNADNMTMSPWGDLVICEDTAMHSGLVGMTAAGEQYHLANNPYTNSELAGVCFSPDGEVLFVNVQHRGLTLAISGPWTTLPGPS